MCLHSGPLRNPHAAVSCHVPTQVSLFMCLPRCLVPHVYTAPTRHFPTQRSPAIWLRRFLLPCAYICIFSSACTDVPGYVPTQVSPAKCLGVSTQLSEFICLHSCLLATICMQLSPATCLHSCFLTCATQLSPAISCPMPCAFWAISWHAPTHLSSVMCLHSSLLPCV
jgi:hypothetical protein